VLLHSVRHAKLWLPHTLQNQSPSAAHVPHSRRTAFSTANSVIRNEGAATLGRLAWVAMQTDRDLDRDRDCGCLQGGRGIGGRCTEGDCGCLQGGRGCSGGADFNTTSGIGGGCGGCAGFNTTGSGNGGGGLNTTSGGCCSLGFAKTPELGILFDISSSTFGFATTSELSFDSAGTPELDVFTHQAELEELESSTAFTGAPELDMWDLGLFLGCTPLRRRISSISWQKASDRNSSRNADSPCRTLSP